MYDIVWYKKKYLKNYNFKFYNLDFGIRLRTNSLKTCAPNR